MGNLGGVVSQQGYDVNNSEDRFKVFSSAFKTLKIYSVTAWSTTIPTAGNVNKVTYTHNLGYFAPAIVVYNGSTTIGTNSSYFMSDSVFPLTLNLYTNKVEIIVDEYFDQGFSSTGATVNFTIYQFLDEFDTYSSSTIGSGSANSGNSADYGIRVSKEGFDVKTCADVDCILSSSFFTNIVHRIGNHLAVANAVYEVTHGLGYIPSFLGYVKKSGDSFLTYSTYNIFTTASDTNKLYINQTTGDNDYYIIFKNGK